MTSTPIFSVGHTNTHIIQEESKYLKITHLNTRPRKGKVHQLRQFLDSLTFSADVVLLDETVYRSEDDAIHIPGYNSFLKRSFVPLPAKGSVVSVVVIKKRSRRTANNCRYSSIAYLNSGIQRTTKHSFSQEKPQKQASK